MQFSLHRSKSAGGSPADSSASSLRAIARGIGQGFHARRAAGMTAIRPLTRGSIVLGLVHALLFTAVYWIAYLLRFDLAVPQVMTGIFFVSLPWVLAAKLVVFYLLGHFHGWWRYVTFADLPALARATILSFLVFVTVEHFLAPFHVPRVVLVLDCLMTIFVIGAARSGSRLYKEQLQRLLASGDRRSAVLIGASYSDAILAHQLNSHPQCNYYIRGLVDLSGQKNGLQIGGVPVLGDMEQVEDIVLATRATDILVAAGSLPGPMMRELIAHCDEAGVTLKIISQLSELVNGSARQVPVRDVQINDLLRRDPVELNSDKIASLLEGRTVLVTGAGGSIGSEICRQIMRFNPGRLVLLEKSENNLFMIERELSVGCESKVVACIADITDRQRMRNVFSRYRPHVVFHAAAHKHVPMMEMNVGEAVKNNVLGTKCVADLADEFGVGSFVLISTDKAVKPTSIMGVTKQIAERYVHTVFLKSATRYMAVRFGNVLGSAGSVVPIFMDQIRRGGPITVTDPRMTRFFMTIPEASHLVLEAAAMGRGGEIFVLDMGEPIRIVDLAQDLIRLAGLPSDAIEIVFTGLRPGEKLYEELYQDEEEMMPTAHPKIRAVYCRPYEAVEVRAAIGELQEIVDASPEVIRRKLQEVVPEYSPHRPAAPAALPDSSGGMPIALAGTPNDREALT
ncbi:MAG: polysaccharide biosynthesis protein [Planctomycetes bacterium]|nr:polysaccharide biosynthesis protein [Planctomycetota bacterium]